MTEQGQLLDLCGIVQTRASEPSAVVKPRLLRANRAQGQWQVTDLEGLLGADHPARAVWAFVEGLDMSEYVSEVRAIEGHAGRPAIDPAILLGLWLFALSQGVGSARELDRLTQEHDAYRWLCGGVPMNYHTLSDFRNGDEQLDRLLSQSLAVLMKEGILTLERVSQDGMRVRASAGAASFRQKESLQKYLIEAEAQVARLKNEGDGQAFERSARQQKAVERAAREREERVRRALEQLPEVEATRRRRNKEPEEARTSTTDPQARIMKMADGGFRPAYNAQVACDAKTRIAVAVAVGNLGSDMAQLPPMLTQLEARFGALPKEVLVDGGYPSQASITDATARGVTVFAPVQKPKDGGRDRYQPLPNDDQARAAWRLRMGTAEAKEIYKERGSTIEWVNAGFRRFALTSFPVRGLRKTRAVLILTALAHNLFRVRAIHRAHAT